MFRATDLDLNDLPPAPQLLVELVDAFTRDGPVFDELERIISRDSALSARVLAVANSAAYRQWNDVLDLKRILVTLGLHAIKSLALTTAVHQYFASHEARLGRSFRHIWLEALVCAHCARRLAELLGHRAPEEAHLVGLMHGIGQLLLLTRGQESYFTILDQATSPATLQELERQHFGISNPELAARLFAHWGLAPDYQQAVRHQHSAPEDLRDMPLLVRVINTATRASFNLASGAADDRVDDQLFGLNQALIDGILEESEAQARQEAGAFGIDTSAEHDGAEEAAFTQRRLAQRVRGIALVDGMQGELTALDDRAELLAVIDRQFTLVFGAQRAVFYLLEDGGKRLAPITFAPPAAQLPTHSIDFIDGQNLVSSCLARRQLVPLRRDDASGHSAFDRYLLEAFGAAALWLVPLADDHEAIGVAAVVIPEGREAEVGEQHELLRYFGRACATALRQQQARRDGEQRKQQIQHEAELVARRALVHEVASPLTVIGNYLELLRTRATARPRDGDEISLIQQEIERIARMMTQFRDQAAEQPALDAVRLNDIVRQLVALLQPSRFDARRIEVDLVLDDTVPALRTDSGALRQILTNLLNNACEALPRGGRIRVATRAMTVVDQQPFVELTVADNGPGIGPDMARQLFRPVTSTKGGEHEGLGLTIVYQLVKRLRGSISYRAAAGGGAEFAVLIPSCDNP